MELSQLIEAWEELRVKDVGELGFCDLERALTNAGVKITGNLDYLTSQSPEDIAKDIAQQKGR